LKRKGRREDWDTIGKKDSDFGRSCGEEMGKVMGGGLTEH